MYLFTIPTSTLLLLKFFFFVSGYSVVFKSFHLPNVLQACYLQERLEIELHARGGEIEIVIDGDNCTVSDISSGLEETYNIGKAEKSGSNYKHKGEATLGYRKSNTRCCTSLV